MSEDNAYRTGSNKAAICGICLGIVILVVIFFSAFNSEADRHKSIYENDLEIAEIDMNLYSYDYEYRHKESSKKYTKYAEEEHAKYVAYAVARTSVLIVGIAGTILIFTSSIAVRLELNNRVQGKAIWGKGVDIPIDAVNGVVKSAFNGVTIITSHGRFAFPFLIDREKAFMEMKNRTSGKTVVDTLGSIENNAVISNQPVSEADEIRKFKELLDQGIITQEEFDAKKKLILKL